MVCYNILHGHTCSLTSCLTTLLLALSVWAIKSGAQAVLMLRACSGEQRVLLGLTIWINVFLLEKMLSACSLAAHLLFYRSNAT